MVGHQEVNNYIFDIIHNAVHMEEMGILVRINPETLLDDLATEICALTKLEFNEVKSTIDYTLTCQIGDRWQYGLYEMLDRGEATSDDETRNFEALLFYKGIW